jgi:hypothetical protein
MSEINHLQEHEHAFLDSNNRAINVATFGGHDHGTLQAIAEHLTAKKIICCCVYGKAHLGDQWDEENNQWIVTPYFVIDKNEQGEWYVVEQESTMVEETD